MDLLKISFAKIKHKLTFKEVNDNFIGQNERKESKS